MIKLQSGSVVKAHPFQPSTNTENKFEEVPVCIAQQNRKQQHAPATVMSTVLYVEVMVTISPLREAISVKAAFNISNAEPDSHILCSFHYIEKNYKDEHVYITKCSSENTCGADNPLI